LQAKRGGLANTPADDLLAALFKATFARTGVDPADVGDVVIGSVLGPSSQRANEARIAMFLAGMPETVPVHTVNRCVHIYLSLYSVLSYVEYYCLLLCLSAHNHTLTHTRIHCRQCSSGLQAIASVAASIKAGYYTMGLAGGVETMSKNPMTWEGGINPAIESSKQAQSCLMPMGITSENVAAKFGVSR
jgi:acetyl-CoA acyltransferase 1